MPKSKRVKRPDYYKAPLRKRSDIVDFLMHHSSSHVAAHRCLPHKQIRFAGPFWLLCWELGEAVAPSACDMSYENLRDRYIEGGGSSLAKERFLDPVYQAQLRELHERLPLVRLWQPGETSLRRDWDPAYGDACRMLWEGDLLDVEYRFFGADCRWLALTRFNQYVLDETGLNDLRGEIATDSRMPYADLVKLYKLVVQIDHDSSPARVTADVEHGAAYHFFEHHCRDVPLPLATKERAESRRATMLANLSITLVPRKRRVMPNHRAMRARNQAE